MGCKVLNIFTQSSIKREEGRFNRDNICKDDSKHIPD